MGVRELPPQVAIVCDECQEELHGGEWDLLLHFDVERADEGAREHGWRVVGGKHICAACQEAKGQEVNE
jgi:hypothetical protein